MSCIILADGFEPSARRGQLCNLWSTEASARTAASLKTHHHLPTAPRYGERGRKWSGLTCPATHGRWRHTFPIHIHRETLARSLPLDRPWQEKKGSSPHRTATWCCSHPSPTLFASSNFGIFYSRPCISLRFVALCFGFIRFMFRIW